MKIEKGKMTDRFGLPFSFCILHFSIFISLGPPRIPSPPAPLPAERGEGSQTCLLFVAVLLRYFSGTSPLSRTTAWPSLESSHARSFAVGESAGIPLRVTTQTSVACG